MDHATKDKIIEKLLSEVERLKGLTAAPAAPMRAFMLRGCPFCTKYLVWMAEAGLMDQIQIVMETPEIREMLKAAGKEKPTFPCVEVAKGEFMYETLDLIEYFKKKHNITKDMAAFNFYDDGVFTIFRAMYGELGHAKVMETTMAMASWR